jgi:hypothetical protein
MAQSRLSSSPRIWPTGLRLALVLAATGALVSSSIASITGTVNGDR